MNVSVGNLPAECKSESSKQKSTVYTSARLCVCVSVCAGGSLYAHVTVQCGRVCVSKCRVCVRFPADELCVTVQCCLTHQFSGLGRLQDLWRNKDIQKKVRESFPGHRDINLYRVWNFHSRLCCKQSEVNMIYGPFTRWSIVAGRCWNLYEFLF